MNNLGLRPSPLNWKSTRDDLFYRIIKEGSIFLGVPSLSSGNVLEDKSSFGNHGTNEGVHVQTRYDNGDETDGKWVGNGEDYVSLTKAPNIGTYTFLWIGVLPKYSSDSTIAEFEYDGADTDTRLIQHVGANTLRLGNKVATVNQNMDMAGVPENELIIYMLSVTGTTVEQYVFHKSGVINQSDTLSNVQVQTPANSTLFGRFDGSIPAQSGFSSSLIPFYNEAKLEPFGQNAYDLLIANNGVLASSLLNTLSPTGATIAPATWTAQATDIETKELGTPDLDITLVSNAIPTGGSTSVFLRESANVTEKLELRMVITSGNLEIYEYDPTATLLGTVTAIETDSMRIAVRDKQVDIYRNGGTTSVFSNTLQDETLYGTQMSVVINGTHTIDLKLEDTFGKSLANDIELMQHLDADAYFRLGQLAEQLGYTAQDMTANEVRILNGVFNFLESDSALTIPYNARMNTDTSIWLALVSQYSTGGVGQARLFDQAANFLRNDNPSGLNRVVDYATTDIFSEATTGVYTFGERTLLGSSLDESDDTIEIYSNSEQQTLTTDVAGTGGRIVVSTDFTIGNRSAFNRAIYGTMSKFPFLHQLATEALMRWLQVHLRIRQYYQDSGNILQPTINLIPDIDGTFHNTVDNTQVSGTNLALGTTVDDIGAYPIDFDGTNSNANVGVGTVTDNIFDGGATIVIRAKTISTTAEFDYLLDKTEWSIYTNGVVGGFAFLQFIHSFNSGGNKGRWFTTDRVFPTNEDVEISITYDNSDVLNDPILEINGVIQTITEAQTPSGVRDSDIGSDLTVGRATNSWEGTVSQVSISETLSAIDIMRHRNLISANGSESMKYALDNHSPIVLLPMNEVSGSAIYNLADPDEEFTAANIATYEAERSPNGSLAMEFGGTNSVIYNVSLPTVNLQKGTFSCWFNFDDPSDSSNRYIVTIFRDVNNEISVNKSIANNLLILHKGNGVTRTLAVSATGYIGWHQLAFTWDTTITTLVATIDGVAIGSLTNIVAWTGTNIPFLIFGAANSGGANSFDGKLGLPLLDTVAWTEAEMLAYYESNVGELIT